MICGIVGDSVVETPGMSDVGADWFVLSGNQALLHRALAGMVGESRRPDRQQARQRA